MTDRTASESTTTADVPPTSSASDIFIEKRIQGFSLSGIVQNAVMYEKKLDIDWEKPSAASSPQSPVTKSESETISTVNLRIVILTCAYYAPQGAIVKKTVEGMFQSDCALLHVLRTLFKKMQSDIDLEVNPDSARLYLVVHTPECDKLVDLPYNVSDRLLVSDVSSRQKFRILLDFC